MYNTKNMLMKSLVVCFCLFLLSVGTGAKTVFSGNGIIESIGGEVFEIKSIHKYTDDYVATVVFKAGYRIGDYIEFVGVEPISAGQFWKL